MEVENSIYLSVATKIGGIGTGEDFPTDLVDAINTCFAYCHQYDCGPKDGFAITGETETWDDFVCKNAMQKNLAKTYIFLKTKRIFDPPQSGPLLSALDKEIEKQEWFITNQR